MYDIKGGVLEMLLCLITLISVFQSLSPTNRLWAAKIFLGHLTTAQNIIIMNISWRDACSDIICPEEIVFRDYDMTGIMYYP